MYFYNHKSPAQITLSLVSEILVDPPNKLFMRKLQRIASCVIEVVLASIIYSFETKQVILVPKRSEPLL